MFFKSVHGQERIRRILTVRIGPMYYTVNTLQREACQHQLSMISNSHPPQSSGLRNATATR